MIASNGHHRVLRYGSPDLLQHKPKPSAMQLNLQLGQTSAAHACAQCTPILSLSSATHSLQECSQLSVAHVDGPVLHSSQVQVNSAPTAQQVFQQGQQQRHGRRGGQRGCCRHAWRVS